MHSRLLIPGLAFTFFLFSCKEQDAARVEINGELKNIEATRAEYPDIFGADSIKVVLYEVPFGSETQPIQLDSTYVTKQNGKFQLEAIAPKQGLYEISVEGGPMIPLI